MAALCEMRRKDGILQMNRLVGAIGDALKSLKRNLSVSLASVATVTATLLIFGLFLMVALSVNHLVQDVEGQTIVRVFLDEEASAEQKTALEATIRSQPGVAEAVYEDQVTAFEKARAALSEDSTLLEGFSAQGNNPYPDSFIVRLEKPEFAQGLETAVTGAPGVESVANDTDLVNTLINWSKTIRSIGVIIFAILILISLFLIGNSIKLAVYGRRKEIEIMKFVGATNWFIRWPFMIEGILIGLMGAALAVLLLYVGYRYAFAQASLSLPFLSLPDPSVISGELLWQFVLAGMLIGALGSFLSIRRHLNV